MLVYTHTCTYICVPTNVHTWFYTCAGAVIGFVNVGDINTHLQTFAQSLSSDNKTMGTIASTMLVVMVRGLFSQLKYPYAQFPCNSLSGDEMFDPFWESVARLERLGFKVMGLCCDGLAANRRLFSLHSDEPNAYKTVNPYAEETRHIFFFSDPPHLLKTVRNAWANPKRHLAMGMFLIRAQYVHAAIYIQCTYNITAV